MDLSTLPLMPSMDLPPPVEAPVPTAQRPSFADTGWETQNDGSDGCQCAGCQLERRALALERDRSASSMRQQYGYIAVPPTPMIWETTPTDWPAVADAFSGAVTGRISASQPAMANILRAAPPMQSSRRIRGRYTTDRGANVSMAGHGRWLDPDTGALYLNENDPDTINVGLTPRIDGTWTSNTGMVWEAT